MDIAIESSFEKAFAQVFEELGLDSIAITKTSGNDGPCDVMSSIGITGALHGYLILRFDKASLDGFIDHLSGFLGMDKASNGEAAYRKSVVGEISNQTAGRSMMLLSESGFDCLITPPTILTGISLTASSTEFNDCANYAITASFGKISAFVGLKKR
jgi:CheY-specific phosphatase CheX